MLRFAAHRSKSGRIPRTSFYIGDSFKLHVSLENGSNLRIAVSASIKQDVKFAAGQGKQKWDGKTIATVANLPMPNRELHVTGIRATHVTGIRPSKYCQWT